MPRSKSFDVDEVLDRAVDLFWLNGLAATSVEDLVTHLGINRGSLYATFTSKEALYHQALDRYHQGSIEWMRSFLAADGRTLRDRLHELLQTAASSDDHRGCFMMNTATERNSVDDSCREVTSRSISDMTAVLSDAIDSGAADGGPGNVLIVERSSTEAAASLITVLQGLRAMATMAEASSRPAGEPTIQLVLDSLFGTPS